MSWLRHIALTELAYVRDCCRRLASFYLLEQEAQIKELNENFSKQVEDLQKLYEGYMKDKEAAEAALKGQGLGLAKAVRKSLEAKTDEL